jgi:hypothetical protein
MYECFGFRVSIPTRDLKETDFQQTRVSRIVVRDSELILGLSQLSILNFSKFKVGQRIEIRDTSFLKRKALGMINQK